MIWVMTVAILCGVILAPQAQAQNRVDDPRDQANRLAALIANLTAAIEQLGDPLETTIVEPEINIGTRVVTTSNLRVRDDANGTNMGIVPADTDGTVVGGPLNIDGYQWWKIVYVNGQTGWSAGNWLRKTTPPSVNIATGEVDVPVQNQPEEENTETSSPVASNTITIGSRIITTANLRVRNTAAGVAIGGVTIGSTGVITDGPVTGNGYNWWELNYDDGKSGWSAAPWLNVITEQTQEQTNRAQLNIQTSANSPENIDFELYELDESSEYEVFVFTIKEAGGVQATINEIGINVNAGSTAADDFIDELVLYNGSEKIASLSPRSNNPSFENLTLTIPANGDLEMALGAVFKGFEGYSLNGGVRVTFEAEVTEVKDTLGNNTEDIQITNSAFSANHPLQIQVTAVAEPTTSVEQPESTEPEPESESLTPVDNNETNIAPAPVSDDEAEAASESETRKDFKVRIDSVLQNNLTLPKASLNEAKNACLTHIKSASVSKVGCFWGNDLFRYSTTRTDVFTIEISDTIRDNLTMNGLTEGQALRLCASHVTRADSTSVNCYWGSKLIFRDGLVLGVATSNVTTGLSEVLESLKVMLDRLYR